MKTLEFGALQDDNRISESTGKAFARRAGQGRRKAAEIRRRLRKWRKVFLLQL